MRVRQLARTRQMQIVEPRQPEAQSRRTQQARPLGALLEVERTHAIVCGDERTRSLGIERAGIGAVALDAPIVDRDRDVVGESVGGSEAEIDDAGDAAIDRTINAKSRSWVKGLIVASV